MPEVAQNITRFRKNLKQFVSLKEAGKLNGQAAAIEEKLKDSAAIAGLDFDQEMKGLKLEGKGEKAKVKSKPKAKSTSVARKNPVKVPFTVTLKKLDKLHSIRSAKKLNKYVGHKHECFVKDQGKINSHIAFRYTPDYREKKYTLDLLLDGKLTHTACASGESASFVTAWKEIVDKYGDLEIEIRDQQHAKKVLGAAEYRRQEGVEGKSRKKAESSTKREKPKSRGLNTDEKEAFKILPFYQKQALNNQDLKGLIATLKDFSSQYQEIPDLRAQDGKGKDATIYIHIFNAGSDWYITELDKDTLEGFGFAVLNGDWQMAELGYISLKELLGRKNYEVGKSPEVDLHWDKKTINEVISQDKPNAKKPEKSYKDFPIGCTVKTIGLPAEVDGKSNPLVGAKGTVTHSQKDDVVVDIEGYGESGFLPKNLEHIESKEEPTKKDKETYSPTFSQLAVFLAFQRMHEYDHENKLNRIENYQRKFLLGKKDKLYIKETWHNREFNQDHTRWSEISKAGKFDTIYSSDVPVDKNLKPVQVDETIDVPKSKMKPVYDLDNYDEDNYKNRQQINRAVLLREIILGKMEAARYKGFDGMTDSTRFVPKDEIEWFDPTEDGWFWSRMFRNFTTPKAYNSPNHWNPGVITFDDFELRYKGSDAGRGGKKKEEKKSQSPDEFPIIQGKETTVDFKADGTISEPAFYALVEVKDVVASHNKDCSPNSKHTISKAQPRDRSQVALCAQPKFIAKNLNPSSITEGNLAFNGTPVTTVMLQAVQGNGRSIALKIAYDEVPKKAAEYKGYLEKNASKFGFTKQQVQTLSQPVLIRVLDVSESRAIELGNVVDTSQAKMNKIDAAKAYVRNLPEAKRKMIGDIINDSSGETLGEVIDDKGLKIFDQFKDLDRSDLVANNALTSEGKDFLRSVFAGLVFDSEDRKGALQAFLSLPHQIKAGLERSYGHLIPFVGSKADITPEVRGAVMIVDALSKRDGIETVDELFQSVDAFDGTFADKYSLREKALAKFLVNTTTQKEIRNAFRMYQYFNTGKEDLFNPIKKTTPDIAFRLAFIEKHRMNPVWSEETRKSVADLDKEFFQHLKEKGINPRSKEAADTWKEDGFQKRFKEITTKGRVHKLKVRIQRLQTLGNDNSKEISLLNELIGKDGWKWNKEKTQINIVRKNPVGPAHNDTVKYPKTARFVFLGIMDRMTIDQGQRMVELQGPHALFTNKKKDKIFIAPFDLIQKFPSKIKDKKAEEIYQEWNNFAPDNNDMVIAWPGEKDLPVGSAHEIYYISDKVLRKGDKKGKMNMYHHKFDAHKRPAAKKGNVLVVGNLEIDERGILN